MPHPGESPIRAADFGASAFATAGSSRYVTPPFKQPRTTVADIFREVDEELSRDRALAAWRKHGKYVIAFAVVAVLAVAGFSAWQDYRERQRLAEGRAYVQALELVMKDDQRAALAAMTQIVAEGGGYRWLALLEEASLKVKAGDRPGAVKIYDDLAANDSASRPFRDLATILSVMVTLDDGQPSALLQKLKPLAAPDSAFRPSALELEGLLALRDGNFKSAKQDFGNLADDATAPQNMRQRATQILAWIGERGGS
jgi:hypothetical protein